MASFVSCTSRSVTTRMIFRSINSCRWGLIASFRAKLSFLAILAASRPAQRKPKPKIQLHISNSRILGKVPSFQVFRRVKNGRVPELNSQRKETGAEVLSLILNLKNTSLLLDLILRLNISLQFWTELNWAGSELTSLHLMISNLEIVKC